MIRINIEITEDSNTLKMWAEGGSDNEKIIAKGVAAHVSTYVNAMNSLAKSLFSPPETDKN